MIDDRETCAGRRPAQRLIDGIGIAAALALAAMPLPAYAGPSASAAHAAHGTSGSGADIAEFYRSRAGQPLWLASGSTVAADELLTLLATARADGLDPTDYRLRDLHRAVRSARSGDPRSVRRAEVLLSDAFVRYARHLQQAPGIGMIYVDAELAPRPQSPRELLDQAAAAPSLAGHVAGLGWMSPFYAELRRALVDGRYRSDEERQRLRVNLERARSLPGGTGRYIVMNAAAQRLFVFDKGQIVDSMRVVVGKPKYPTPMMAAYIRYAALNPYWNVPPDLAAERIAPNVVSQGARYLRERGYQVLSDWTDSAQVVDPRTVDWKAVAEGRTEVRIRQLPGPHNAMGRMKFMFPNSEGVYLHDTPEKELLSEASRLFSGGCVRLEDAPRLGQWLFGTRLDPKGKRPEQEVPLQEPVPVYLTYLTAEPNGSEIAYYDDIYGRDAERLARSGGAPDLAASR